MEPVVRIPQIYHEAVLPKQQGMTNTAEPSGNIYDEIREKESLGVKNNRVSVLLIITVIDILFSLYVSHSWLDTYTIVNNVCC